MTKLLKAFWRVITFPFVLIFNILAFPFRLIQKGIRFLNMDVEDRPILDTFTTLASEPEARAGFWDHIEDLRMHLFRMLIGLAIGVGATGHLWGSRNIAVL